MCGICEICMWEPGVKYVKPTIKTPEQCEWRCSGIFICNFRGIFTAQLNNYDGTFLAKIVNSHKQKYSTGF